VSVDGSPLQRHVINPRVLPEIIDRPSVSNASITSETVIGTPSNYTTPTDEASLKPIIPSKAPSLPTRIDFQAHATLESPNPSISSSSSTGEDRVEEDDDVYDSDARRTSVTSHAEAFGTLDHVTLEQMRARRPQGAAGKSWFSRNWSGVSTARTAPGGFRPIDPPWVTLTPRGQQEEQTSTIKTLKTSFVSLLSSSRKKGGGEIGDKSGRRGKRMHDKAFANVPDDALCMMLPLWPKETDATSAAKEPPGQKVTEPQLENRLYLLVYFADMGEATGDGNGGGLSGKKRSRGDTGSSEKGSRHEPLPTVLFESFKVIGRLMSYDDLRGSGVRLPSYGLSITGSLVEAANNIPRSQLRTVYQDEFVIALCTDHRAGKIEFYPEGLEKLGLCVPRENAQGVLYDPEMQTADYPEDESLQPLTAIGRAAVEIIWLGCLSLTSFGDL
jgi:hypothetical protein